MLNVCQILVSGRAGRLVLVASVVALLGACGQTGPLFIPTDSAAQGRATLPETIRPAATLPAGPASAPPATGTASPLHLTP